jgi:hypothetical protein
LCDLIVADFSGIEGQDPRLDFPDLRDWRPEPFLGLDI